MKASISQLAQALYDLTDEKSAKETDRAVLNFAKFLVRGGQLKKSRMILEKFEKIWNEKNGRIKIEVRSGRELSEKAKKRITDWLKEKYQAEEAELMAETDENLLGGVVARVGDDVLDASVRGGLERLRIKLVK